MKKTILLSAGLMLIILIFVKEVTAQTLHIDMDSTRQLIRGFGGMNHTTWINDLNEDQREKAFGNDPGELGLSILRIHVNPNESQFNLEVPTALHATEKGAIVFASPWDPPVAMLDPESEVRKLHYDMYDDYAEHLDSLNKFMTANGVPLYAISVQNEPDWDGGWTQWTNVEMIKFLEENAQDIQTRVLAPESYQFRRPYTDAILNDPEASANLDIVGGHIYGAGLEDYPLAREMGKEVWMTEHYTSSDRSANLWPDALLVGNEINNCMLANFNAYVWWYIRRFYGLITDDGSISKRGYVMSQFSKFVRPGAVRVDATPADAPGVDASAFVTDSTLVIVVINSNDSEVSLDFTLQNNTGIDTLIQFTTSETKNIVNDGGIDLSGDTFSATIDANSITTFTSSANDGGKYNNLLPTANAGDDILVEDSDGNGSENIILDGTASSDPDGTIVNYSWAVDEMQVAWESNSEVSLDIGEYLAVLTVTDEDGATNTDSINIAVTSNYTAEIWLEAECSRVGSTWEINPHAEASHGEYVNTPAGNQSLDAPSADTADHLIFTFQVDEAGPYKVWGRVITPSPDDDSYWVRIDGDETWAMWNSIPSGSNWHWDDVHDQNNNSEVMVYDLDVGEHTLSICYREDGALLDKIYLTNAGIIPTGIGEEDESCPEIPDALDQDRYKDTSIEVFPNPFQDEVQISWTEGFTSLKLISLEGKTMLHKEFKGIQQQAYLSLDLEPGMYLLLLKNEKSSGITKLLIE